MTVRKPIMKNDLESVISNGADVKEDRKKKDWVNFTLRITTSLLREMETMMQDRPELSRNSWIIEAIREKLKRKE